MIFNGVNEAYQRSSNGENCGGLADLFTLGHFTEDAAAEGTSVCDRKHRGFTNWVAPVAQIDIYSMSCKHIANLSSHSVIR